MPSRQSRDPADQALGSSHGPPRHGNPLLRLRRGAQRPPPQQGRARSPGTRLTAPSPSEHSGRSLRTPTPPAANRARAALRVAGPPRTSIPLGPA
eukprot:4243187-Alexandrium_andersonii.AAC.1